MTETDREIAHILAIRNDYGTTEEWRELGRRATDPALKKECEERWIRAYLAEDMAAERDY